MMICGDRRIRQRGHAEFVVVIEELCEALMVILVIVYLVGLTDDAAALPLELRLAVVQFPMKRGLDCVGDGDGGRVLMNLSAFLRSTRYCGASRCT